MSETEDYDKSATPTAHKTSHQDGGSDEIAVTGLAGLLADGQTPLAHKTSHQDGGTDEISVTGLAGTLADDQHIIDAEAVSAMGAKANSNPLNHDRYADSEALAAAVQAGAITDGVTKAPTHDAVYDVKVMTEDHSARHENDGLDEISVAGLSGTLADAQTPAAHKTSHQVGGTDVLDPSGWFQKARAYRGNAQTIPTGAFTKVAIDTDSFDTDNITDLTNNRIKPTKAGYYIVFGNVSVIINWTGARVIAYLFKNGSIYTTQGFDIYSGGVSSGGSVNDIIYFDGVNDYVELLVYQNTGGDRDLTIQSASNFLTVFGPL